MAAIRVSSTPCGSAEAIGNPSADTMAAALTSGIAPSNFFRRSSKVSVVGPESILPFSFILFYGFI
ncbi:MAG: hypothetical protein ACTSVX_09985 [Promethearchaeota archaeon]